MLGVSFSELIFVALIAVIVVGPKRLPMMLNTLGAWSVKLRQMIFQARTQSGIEDILKQEGLLGGLRELRQLRQTVRTEIAELGRVVAEGQAMTTNAFHPPAHSLTTQAATTQAATAQDPAQQAYSPADNTSLEAPRVVHDPYAAVPLDLSREYPVEGCDAEGAIGDDLFSMLSAHMHDYPPPPTEEVPSPDLTSAEPSP